MTLVASALAGGDCIDDADALRAGGTARVLGLTAKAPSTLGAFLRSLQVGPCPPTGPGEPRIAGTGLGGWGQARRRAPDHRPGLHHLRDLRTGQGGRTPPRLHRCAGLSTRCWPSPPEPETCCWPGCARTAPTLPAALPTSCVKRWGGCATPGPGANSRRGPTAASTLIAWYPSAARWMSASPSPSASTKACTMSSRPYLKMPGRRFPTGWTAPTMWQRPPISHSRVSPTPRRCGSSSGGVKPTPGSQLALFATYSYHGFITDRDGEMLELEADHRRHAEIENAIRDLKYGVGLNHMPSGRFAANGAWLAVQAMAHNLARWTARIGLGEQIVTTKTLRRRVFALAGRLTRSARRLTLHLPKHWPWQEKVSRALARLRAIPLPA